MALTLDPATLQITVPQTDLTFISGTLYELDSDAFRKDVMTLFASEAYIYLPFPYVHNTEVTVAGTTFARTLEFINGVNIKLEDTGSQYSVRITGSNNNIFDVENGILIPTSLVTVIPTNSAGLILNQTGLLPGDITAVADAVWNYTLTTWKASIVGGWLTKKLLTVSKFLSLK